MKVVNQLDSAGLVNGDTGAEVRSALLFLLQSPVAVEMLHCHFLHRAPAAALSSFALCAHLTARG